MDRIIRIALFVALVGIWSPVPAQTYLQYADSADIYIAERNWVAAERAVLNALRTEPAHPANPMLFVNLGQIQNRLEKYPKAIESFDLALIRIPNSTVALTGRAEANLSLGRTADALRDLDSAISVDSTLSLPLTMKGYLLLRENRADSALPIFNRLVSLYPEDKIALAGRADCLATLGHSNEAVSDYKKALEKEERPEWRFRAGLLLLEENDLEGAAEQARLSIASTPREGNIYILMALIHRRRFETHEAEIAAKMAREFGADPELILHYLGNKK